MADMAGMDDAEEVDAGPTAGLSSGSPAAYSAANEFAAAALEVGDPTGWFEPLYAAAANGEAVIGWARGEPNRVLVEWAAKRRPDGAGKRAVVVGCGYGDDAEYVAGFGFAATGFDLSATAVEAARRRFGGSGVEYAVADLLDLPADWQHGFDLVVEAHTVQSLPLTLRQRASGRIGRLVGPGGTLLVIAAAREAEAELAPVPPWPLTRAEVDAFATGGLQPVSVEETTDPGRRISRRWLAEFSRPE